MNTPKQLIEAAKAVVNANDIGQMAAAIDGLHQALAIEASTQDDWQDYDGEICHGCGARIGEVTGSFWFAPNDLWNFVEGGEGGLKCPACFVLDCAKVGIHIGWTPHIYHSLVEQFPGADDEPNPPTAQPINVKCEGCGNEWTSGEPVDTICPYCPTAQPDEQAISDDEWRSDEEAQALIDAIHDEQVCSTCGGKRRIFGSRFGHDAWSSPCPDCQPVLPSEGEVAAGKIDTESLVHASKESFANYLAANTPPDGHVAVYLPVEVAKWVLEVFAVNYSKEIVTVREACRTALGVE